MMRDIARGITLVADARWLFYGQILVLVGAVLVEIRHLEDLPLIFAHLLIALFAIAVIVRKNAGMLTQAAGIFFFMFFAIIPIHELNNEIIYWEGSALSYEQRTIGALASLLFVALFYWVLKVEFPKLQINSRSAFQNQNISTRRARGAILIALALLLLVFKLYSFNILALFVKGGEFGGDMNVDAKASFLMGEFFLRPLIFNLGLALIFLSHMGRALKFFCLTIMVVAASPSGVPRFLVAALYLPIVLVYLSSTWRNNRPRLQEHKYLLPNLLLFGLAFVFPFLEVFRYFSFEKLNSFDLFEYLEVGHFDAYQMFMRALDVGTINYGYGFLGTLFFFVPRSIWESKPITSGIEISQIAGLRLDNVSMPIIGEFFLNFWYVGIIIGPVIIALLLKIVDEAYGRYNAQQISLRHLVYFELVGLVVYNMRGGLLSSFAYTVSILFTWALIHLIVYTTTSVSFKWRS